MKEVPCTWRGKIMRLSNPSKPGLQAPSQCDNKTISASSSHLRLGSRTCLTWALPRVALWVKRSAELIHIITLNKDNKENIYNI